MTKEQEEALLDDPNPSRGYSGMSPVEAIRLLRGFQAQIVHGKNTFGDFADAIERLELERDTARDWVAVLLATGGEYYTSSEIALHGEEPSETDFFNQVVARNKFVKSLKEARGK